jgi:hypothetical protein
VLKPAASILGSDGGKRLDNGFLQCLVAPGSNTPQKRFEFGESLLASREKSGE